MWMAWLLVLLLHPLGLPAMLAVQRIRWPSRSTAMHPALTLRERPAILTNTAAERWVHPNFTLAALCAVPTPSHVLVDISQRPLFTFWDESFHESAGRAGAQSRRNPYVEEPMSKSDFCRHLTNGRTYVRWGGPLADWGARPALRLRSFKKMATPFAMGGDATPPLPPTADLWMSAAGVISTAHFDLYNNCYTMLEGWKRFLLVPPEWAHALKPFPNAHAHARQSQLHFGNGEDAHNSSSPGSMRNRTYTADVGPGDTLWIPAGWTHHVIALSPALSVSVTTPCPEFDAMRALLVAHTELLLPRVLAHSEENGAAQRKAAAHVLHTFLSELISDSGNHSIRLPSLDHDKVAGGDDAQTMHRTPEAQQAVAKTGSRSRSRPAAGVVVFLLRHMFTRSIRRELGLSRWQHGCGGAEQAQGPEVAAAVKAAKAAAVGVAQRLAKFRPRLRLVFLSWYIESALSVGFADGSGIDWLETCVFLPRKREFTAAWKGRGLANASSSSERGGGGGPLSGSGGVGGGGGGVDTTTKAKAAKSKRKRKRKRRQEL
jgi:hypothetical protein